MIQIQCTRANVDDFLMHEPKVNVIYERKTKSFAHVCEKLKANGFKTPLNMKNIDNFTLPNEKKINQLM